MVGIERCQTDACDLSASDMRLGEVDRVLTKAVDKCDIDGREKHGGHQHGCGEQDGGD